MKKLISKILVVALLLSMIEANAFVTNAKASVYEQEIQTLVNAITYSSNNVYKKFIGLGEKEDIAQPKFDTYQGERTDKVEENLETAYVGPYTSVKRQGHFGACWMFGGIAAAESNLLHKEKKENGEPKYGSGLVSDDPIDLSEAQAIYTYANAEKINKNSDDDMTYSSNDHGLTAKYQGFSGGGLPVSAAMALSADKGVALESENPFTLSDNIENDLKVMIQKAISQYHLNRFNIKKAEELPEVYPEKEVDERDVLVNETNTNARDVWKKKIMDNGAIYASFFAVKESTPIPDPVETSSKSGSSKERFTKNDTTKKQKFASSNKPIVLSDEGAVQNEKGSESKKGATGVDQREKYFHSWGDNRNDYADVRYQPNYWMFSERQGEAKMQSHVVEIVGYDDFYSKYNFAERLTDPKTNEIRNYDASIAMVEDLKEVEDGIPDLQFSEDGHLKEGCNPEYKQDGSNQNQKHAKYIVPIDNGAWKIKNSYGTSKEVTETNESGEEVTNTKKVYKDGIMSISYCESSLAEAISIEVEENLDQVLQNKKEYNTTLTHSSLKGLPIMGLNPKTEVSEVFTADKGKDIVLKEIGYWTGIGNTHTKLKLYNNLTDKSNPEGGAEYDLGEMKDEYPGYHTIKLEEPITIKDSTSVGVVISQYFNKKDKNGDTTQTSALMMEAEHLYDYPNVAYKANAGDTLIKTSEGWKDLQDSYIKTKASEQNDNIYNSTIKLFGDESDWKKIEYEDDVDQYFWNDATKKNITRVSDLVALFPGNKEGFSIIVPKTATSVSVNGKTKNIGYCQNDSAVIYLSALDKYLNKIRINFKNEDNQDEVAYVEIRNDNVDPIYNMLNCKFQWKNDYGALRFVSTIDGLDYDRVGFIFSGKYGDKTIQETDREITKVYRRISANSNTVLPSLFSDDSQYFFTYTIRGMEESKASSWTVTPYYVKADGTKVMGATSTVEREN